MARRAFSASSSTAAATTNDSCGQSRLVSGCPASRTDDGPDAAEWIATRIAAIVLLVEDLADERQSARQCVRLGQIPANRLSENRLDCVHDHLEDVGRFPRAL